MSGILSFDLFLMRKKLSLYVCLLLPSAFIFLYAMFAGTSSCTLPELFSISSIPILLCNSVFYAMFSGNDLKKGAIKNVAGSLPNRISYVLSKAAAMILYTMLSLGITILTALILSRGKMNEVFYSVYDDMPGLVSKIDAGEFIRYAAIHLLLLIAFMFTVLFICVLTGSLSGTFTFSILYCSGMAAAVFYSLLELIMMKLDIECDFTKISLSMQYHDLSLPLTPEMFRNALIVGAAYILIFGVLSCVVFRRKDIA